MEETEMIGLSDAIKIGTGFAAGMAVVSITAVPIAHIVGKRAGIAEIKAAVQIEALGNTIEVLQSRELTNAEITYSDAVDLCARYGLHDSDAAECLRRVAEATANTGNGSQNHD